ncbi:MULTISPECIES: hypothetical protein [unclassified Pseudovibrio]|uniref:hypothetical protein n=1 Tax=unclassified Pseudovibrio TaxID=2627060 RepID=UPI0007B2DC2E|nr:MULTISPECIES: hypothetical protein [unclassified Pseudovibrio]KZK85735.1 hypothetical protein PsAD46_03326 [Pseudovibrio sp. Ad46]KZL10676.1 hypothetical protein PsAD26_03040 [Pseudovibrio sp. Ad26]
MSGWIRMERALYEHEALKGPLEWGCWGWLIANAAWRKKAIDRAGNKIELEEGQLCFSLRFLAEKWGVTKDKTKRLLDKWQKWNLITIEAAAGGNIITICNYSKYQIVEAISATEMRQGALQERDSDETEAATKKNNLTNKQDNHAESTDVDSFITDAPDVVQVAFDEYSAAVADYNETVSESGVKLPKPSSLTPKRRSALARALRELPEGKSFSDVLSAVGKSPHLLGCNDNGWRMDFDFICKKDKFTQILEGKYFGPARQSQTQSSKRYSGAELFDRAMGMKG